MSFAIGCAIWSFKGWIGSLFPKGTRQSDFLRLYSRALDTVEGNTTFYATPSAETVARWVEATPPTFRFCPKLPREISHAGKLVAGVSAAENFIEHMQGLGERLGPIFLQLPPSYGPEQSDDLCAFIDAWPRDVRLAVEVRHPDFFTPAASDAIHHLLVARGIGRVLMDTRPLRLGPLQTEYGPLNEARNQKPDLPLVPERTAPFTLIRYIGHPQFDLNTAFLDEWATRVGSWLDEGTDVFFFCHCPDDTFSPALCDALRTRLIAQGTISDPPADEEHLEQGRLF